MANAIDIGDFAKTLAAELNKYTEDIAEGVKQATDETAQELLKNTKADAPVRKRRYQKAISIKTVFENDLEKRVRWYVKAPHYRLSHLLEKGHATRNGGRAAAYPHIAKNEETAKTKFVERVERVVKNGGK
jgi:hypothetical protein